GSFVAQMSNINPQSRQLNPLFHPLMAAPPIPQTTFQGPTTAIPFRPVYPRESTPQQSVSGNSYQPLLASSYQPPPNPSHSSAAVFYAAHHTPTAIPQQKNTQTEIVTLSPTPSPLLPSRAVSMQPAHDETKPDNLVTKESKKAFWTAPGMSTLVDWLTDYENHKRLNNPRPVSGSKPIDLQREIAVHVNALNGTEWDEGHVKSKIQYARKKYQDAKTLANSTGEGDTDKTTLRKRMLELCPDYDRFHAVYSGTLTDDPPPPVQSSRYAKGHAFDSDTNSDSTDSEVEASGSSNTENLTGNTSKSELATRSSSLRKAIDDLRERSVSVPIQGGTFGEDNISIGRREEAVRRREDNVSSREAVAKREEAITMRENNFMEFMQYERELLKDRIASFEREREKVHESFEREKAVLERNKEMAVASLNRDKDRFDEQLKAFNKEKEA
ncbi:hypothetical protein BGX20_004588, partial [Mortierella sp. AD010]